MVARLLEQDVAEALAHYPVVALIGPRQVGKTTLALKLASGKHPLHLDLEDRMDLAKAEQIELLFTQNKDRLFILDEVQRLPGIFAPLRVLVDRERRTGKRTGHFLILGSASLDLLRQSSETLAGRIAYLELHPFNVLEVAGSRKPTVPIPSLWLRGGFPESALAATDAVSLDWRRNFIRTYLERDIPQLGPRVPAETMRRFWTMLAHGQGTPLNANKTGANLGVSGVTVARYLDLLGDLLLVRAVRPYHTNIRKRLVKSPRIYIRDSGIAHALLGIGTFDDLLGHPVVGKSWEGFVVENIASVLPRHASMYYYRTTGGAEVDLVLEFSPRERWAIEIKKGSITQLGRGFHEACNDLAPRRKFLVHGQQDAAFPLAGDVTAISLPAIMREIRQHGS